MLSGRSQPLARTCIHTHASGGGVLPVVSGSRVCGGGRYGTGLTSLKTEEKGGVERGGTGLTSLKKNLTAGGRTYGVTCAAVTSWLSGGPSKDFT
jgi:hypothetical protein